VLAWPFFLAAMIVLVLNVLYIIYRAIIYYITRIFLFQVHFSIAIAYYSNELTKFGILVYMRNKNILYPLL
jgi:hypothetical protein